MSPAEDALLRQLRVSLGLKGDLDSVGCIDVLLSGALAEKRSRKAVNQAKLRERKRQHSGNALATQRLPIDHQSVTESATFGGSGGSESGDSSSLSESGSPSPAESPLSTREPATNPSADGAFGMTADVWAEGIRLATGRPCTPPRGKAVLPFHEAVKAHCPKGADAVEWVRSEASRYAQQRLGRGDAADLFGWIKWLNAGCPPPAKSSLVQPAADERIWKIGDGE